MTLGIICSGQGGQKADMLNILDGQPAAHSVFKEAARLTGKDIRKILEQPSEVMFENRNAQLLICALQLASWAALEPLHTHARVFAGYSLGELVAYGCNGALTFKDCLTLALIRSRLMDQASAHPGVMVSVRGLDRRKLDQILCSFSAEIAIFVGPDHFICGCRAEEAGQIVEEFINLGAMASKLPVNIVSHTPAMAAALPPFRRALEKSPFTEGFTPTLAGIDGSLVHNKTSAIEALSRQICEPIDWHRCLIGFREIGCRVVLELGPGDKMVEMVRRYLPDIEARSLSEFRSLNGATKWIMKRLTA